MIDDLPIVTDGATSARALRETMEISRTAKLTSYDAAYLELASRSGLPLATQDAALRKAARQMGVVLIGRATFG